MLASTAPGHSGDRGLSHQTQGLLLQQEDLPAKFFRAPGQIVRCPVDRFGEPSDLFRSAFCPVTHHCTTLLSPRRVTEKYQSGTHTDCRD